MNLALPLVILITHIATNNASQVFLEYMHAYYGDGNTRELMRSSSLCK
jgi:hypothetical protein